MTVGAACQKEGQNGAYVQNSDGTIGCQIGAVPTEERKPEEGAPTVKAPVVPTPPPDPAAENPTPTPDPNATKKLGDLEKKKPVKTHFMTNLAPVESIDEYRLKKHLESKGLNPDDQKVFMKRFDGLDSTTKDKRVKAYLANEEFTKKSGEELRQDIAKWGRDKEVEKCRLGNVSPLETYNNLVAKGIVADDPELRASLVGKTWKDKDVDPKKWRVLPVNSDVVKQIGEDRLIVSRDFEATSEEVRKDTQRHVLVQEAKSQFVAYHTAHGQPPLSKDEAEKRFDKIAKNLGMINNDGTVRNDWDPQAAVPADPKNPGSPARAFFPTGEIFESDGITVKKDVKFEAGRMGDDQVDLSHPENLDPVTRASVTPDSPQLVADFRKKLIEEGYSPLQADFIINNLDPRGRKLADLSPAEVQGYMDGFLSSPKETRDPMIIAQGQNILAKDYAQKMGVSEGVAREYLAMKGVLRRSATMEQVDAEQKRVAGLNAPPRGVSLEAARKDSQYKDWAAERDALYDTTGAHRGDRDGNGAKRNKIKQNLDPADLQYQDQLSMLDNQTQKQMKLKQIEQQNALQLEDKRQDNTMEQMKERHKNDQELENLKHKNAMAMEDMRQKYENARAFVKMAVDFIASLLNTYSQAVNGDKQMLGQITAASINRMQQG